MSLTIVPENVTDLFITTTTTVAQASTGFANWDLILWIVIIGSVITATYFLVRMFRGRGSDSHQIEKGDPKLPDTIESLLAEKEIAVNIIDKIDKAVIQKQIEQQIAEEEKKKQIPPETDSLNIKDIIGNFAKRDDEDYEKSLKTSALEISHAHEDAQKQLELQIEKEKRARLIS